MRVGPVNWVWIAFGYALFVCVQYTSVILFACAYASSAMRPLAVAIIAAVVAVLTYIFGMLTWGLVLQSIATLNPPYWVFCFTFFVTLGGIYWVVGNLSLKTIEVWLEDPLRPFY